MYLTAIVLTDQWPTYDSSTGNVALGNAIDGNFTVEGPGPYTIGFGVYLELDVGPEEEGVFEVALYAEVLSPQGEQSGRGLLRARPMHINPAQAGWTSRRVRFDSYDAEFYVSAECDIDLIVEIDGEYAGERTIRVRRLDLPDQATG